MKELPDFEVVQLAFEYPDDNINHVIRRLNDDMYLKLWRPVGVITSFEGRALYVIYEKMTEKEFNDNLSGVPK